MSKLTRDNYWRYVLDFKWYLISEHIHLGNEASIFICDMMLMKKHLMHIKIFCMQIKKSAINVLHMDTNIAINVRLLFI